MNCFNADTTYSHDCTDTVKTAFIQTQVDNILLTKRYLQEVPTDPRTKSRYVYGVSTDGSYSHLDESSSLEILPATEVEQNDKDGIITKIRLKLTSCKIWNKVVRLASESEFNIETTSAIAGVRGTEFGIDANTDKLIVFSGEVGVCQKSNPSCTVTIGKNDFTVPQTATTKIPTGDPLVYDMTNPVQQGSGQTRFYN